MRLTILTTLLLFPAWAGAAEQGIWRLTERQVEKPEPYPPTMPCKFSHDTGDQGLSFTQTCSTPDRKRTTTQRCQFGWRSAPALDSLRPGQKLDFTGTLSNTGSVGTCQAYIVLAGAGAINIIVGPGQGQTKQGQVTVPDKLVNPRTGKQNPLQLMFYLGGGNETKFVKQNFWYQWSTISSTPAPTAAAPPPAAPAKPATAGPLTYLGCFADKEQRDLNGTPSTWVRDAKSCIQSCASKGFRYASVQAGSHCFCGNSYGRYGASTACKACGGAAGEFCGGTWANSVYEVKR